MSTTNTRSSTIYFSGLNGIRAIAALAVVITHVTASLGEFHLPLLTSIFGFFPDGKPKDYLLGDFGVTIFFALSGFLITFLLQTERERQPIDIKKFYIRRILRIWPLYYLYMAICIAVLLFMGETIDIKALLLYIFFAANIPFIIDIGVPFIGHYWSLGVEEQFYLFWPHINKRLSTTALLKFIVVFICLIVGFRIAIHFLHPYSLLEKAINITRFHCMMIGAAGAILYKNGNRLFLKIANHKLTQVCCWLVILSLAINKYRFASFIDNEFIAVVTLCIIIGQINITNRIISLEGRAFNFLGKISYGIYVIHPLVMFLFARILAPLNIYAPYKYVLAYASVTSASILFAYLSYNYIEKYFLTFKKKFEVVKSSAAKNDEQVAETAGNEYPPDVLESR